MTTATVPTLVRLGGQFDPVGQDLVVATPTCCCCCCCCLVSLTSHAAFSAGTAMADAHSHSNDRSTLIKAGISGFVVAPLILLLFLLNLGSPGLRGPIVIFLILAMPAAQIFLYGHWSKGTRSTKQITKSTLLSYLAFAALFALEFVTLGLAIFGQFLALVIPFFVGRARYRKGLRAHQPPPPVVETWTLPPPTA
jgi:hypothetical protein